MEGIVFLFIETKGIPSVWESFLCSLLSLFIPHSVIHAKITEKVQLCCFVLNKQHI